jgi:hypothetical protein
MSQREPSEVASAVSAYYHLPPVWIGKPPSEREFHQAPLRDLIADVHESNLSCGVKVRVRRDGLFIFDCSQWEPGSATDIPSFEIQPGEKLPQTVTRAWNLTEARAGARTQLMNAHLACLDSALGELRKAASPLRQILSTSDAIQLFDFRQNDLHRGIRLREPTRSYVLNCVAFTRAKRVEHQRSRRSLDLEVVQHSFELLDRVVWLSVPNSLLLVELLYKSGMHYAAHRYAEALILCWTVCEKLINHVWEQHLDSCNLTPVGRIPRQRKEKLRGRDFTASVISEVLELTGLLPYDLFLDIEKIRKARNTWLHSLGDVSDRDASNAIRTAEKMLESVGKIRLSITISKDTSYVASIKQENA